MSSWEEMALFALPCAVRPVEDVISGIFYRKSRLCRAAIVLEGIGSQWPSKGRSAWGTQCNAAVHLAHDCEKAPRVEHLLTPNLDGLS